MSDSSRTDRAIATHVVLLAILTLWCGSAYAQLEPQITVHTEPANPTSNTPVTIVITTVCGYPAYDPTFARNGFNFDVPRSDAFVSFCLGQAARYDVGLLAPGNYAVRDFPIETPSDTRVIGAFNVAAVATVPLLDSRGLIALALVLAFIAAWTLGH